MQSGGRGGGQIWSVNGQYAHFILSWSTQKPCQWGVDKWDSSQTWTEGAKRLNIYTVSVYTQILLETLHILYYDLPTQ